MTTEPMPRDRITIATMELIADHGMADVTMSAIATQAGVARQTLYNHFPDVESIVVAAYAHHHAENIAQLQRILATAPDPAAKLVQFIRHQVAVAAHSHHGALMDAGLSPSAQQRVHEQHAEMVELLHDILVSGSVAGVFRSDLDAAATATLVLHMVGGAADLDEAGSEVAAIVAAAEALVLGGVRT